MAHTETPGPETPHEATRRLDAIVIGAGLGGLRALHEFRSKGLSVAAFEAAPDLGGTWYWNRYPGARTDSESWTYAYAFSQELQDEWDWPERFATQADMYAYLCFAAEKHGWRDHIEFDTRVSAATFDETTNRWTITTQDGRQFSAQFLVTALGLLSRPYIPAFAGINDFQGDWFVTGRWPSEGADLAGKRVAVIGTGATGVQAVPLVAKVADHVSVFQRTPNFVLPARNYTLTDFEREQIRRDYDEIWAMARRHPLGYAFPRANRRRGDVTPEEHRQVLEAGWEAGGFRFLYETFDDITTDPEANAIASEFVREKIRAIVKDPATAELLCPKDHPLGSKRPPLGHFYYEAFNRENVEIVDVSREPISRITPRGITVGNVEHEVDVIIFATGFDAGSGSYDLIDIRGRGGQALREAWASGARTHLGLMAHAFPNMFMISGPQSPFGNIPVVVEAAVTWIGRCVERMRASSIDAIEPRRSAVREWHERLTKFANMTVLPQGTRSWMLGGNIPGKAPDVLFYFGGVGTYVKACDAALENDLADFHTGRVRDTAAV
ncbi:NAD(P)/FAD-dependent oxidoreductase [Rhodococcus sp. USK13]|uniref:flavin-containing monooxygenase n=1 Tax=Rhodococcus sp. USK13 TaxID=2806442 RepID=UPI001BCF76A4|nr:NAD(P)/FAD-dependent oxidoreductase [Rhodococcus sp. USK13]